MHSTNRKSKENDNLLEFVKHLHLKENRKKPAALEKCLYKKKSLKIFNLKIL